MPLTTIVDPAGVWNTAPCTITTIVVFPPGLDLDHSRATPITIAKNAGFSAAIGDIVCLAQDAAGEVAVFVNRSQRGMPQLYVTVAAASGDASITGYRIPRLGITYSRVMDNQYAGPGANGYPTVDAVRYSDAQVSYAPVSGQTIYGYIDGGGVERTTSSQATALAGVASWIVGAARSRVATGPGAVPIARHAVHDYGRSAGAIAGLSKLDAKRAAQLTGTPPAALGSPVYTDIAGTTISATVSASNCLFAGYYVGRDTRTSPTTYWIQEVPYVADDVDPMNCLRPVLANIFTDTSFVRPLLKSSNDQIFMNAKLMQIGLHCDNFYPYVRFSTSRYMPADALQIFAPIYDNAPTFAVDCTLPDPFGDVRVIWSGGGVRLTKRTDHSTPPRTGMVLSNWNPSAPSSVSVANFNSSDYNYPQGLTRAENGPCPYPLYGWGSPRYISYGTYTDLISPYRLGIINANTRFLVNAFANPGSTSQRLEWTWCKRNASSRTLYDLIGSPTSVATPTAFVAGSLDSIFYDLSISGPPSGLADDVGTYGIYYQVFVTYAGIEYLWDTQYATPLGLKEAGYSPGIVASPVGGGFGPIDNGALLPASGDPWPLEVHPEDIIRWQPAPNDSDCSYVGHCGWRWPDNTRMPAVTRTANLAASWSADVLSITALPGITWTGDAFVDGPSTTPNPVGAAPAQYAFRVTCPEAGLSLHTMPGAVTQNQYNLGSIGFQGWQPSEVAAPVGSGPVTGLPILIGCPKPVASGSIDILVEVWDLRFPGTTYGGNAQLANYQRMTITIP